MDLLKRLKEISDSDLKLPVFIRMSTFVGNIRSVDVVSSKVFKKGDGELCQVLSLRNSDFDKDYIQNYCEAKGVELEYDEDEGYLEDLCIDPIESIEELIADLELNLNKNIQDIRYSALTGLSGKEYVITSINKDVYHMFGLPNDCFIIEVK
tara:strand:- start:24119 stop:24574 length:456 start_codon:yes stop_codon:yes gene_type:complete